MQQKLYAGVVALALFGGAGIAAAQSGSSGASGSASGRVDLTPAQEQTVRQGLASQATTSAPAGYQGQIGSKLPDSIATQQLPSNVTSQVPEAQALVFVKLPDRVLLVDPASKMIAEIIPVAAGTTGSASDGSSGASGSSSGK
jgi:hypothetical protein